MQPRKILLSYDDIEKNISASERFKKILFELKNPENRNEVLKRLSACNLPDKDLQLECLPSLGVMVEELQKVIALGKLSKISLDDIYNQVFIKLFKDDNVSQIKKSLDKALKNGSISLLSHYKVIKFLSELAECNAFCLALCMLPKAAAEHKQESQSEDYAKAMQVYLHDSGLINYLNVCIDKLLSEKISNWLAFKRVSDNLNQKELEAYILSKHHDWSNSMLHLDLYALRQSKKSHESSLPKDNNYYQMAMDYIRVDQHSITELCEFVNKYYNQFEFEVSEKIKPEQIMQLMDDYSQCLMSKQLVHVIVPDNSESKLQSFGNMPYAAIKFQVDQLIQYAATGVGLEASPQQWADLWNYTKKLNEDDHAVMQKYLFAFLHHVVNKTYYGNAADEGIAWLNNVLDNMLMQKTYSPEAQKVILDVAIMSIFAATENGVVFGRTLFPGIMPTFYNQNANRRAIPAELRELFLEDAKKISLKENKSQHVTMLDEVRTSLLSDLSRKEREYKNDLQNSIPLYIHPGDRDVRKSQKLILRLAAVNYLREKISSGQQLSSSQIHDEMLNLFGPLVFETRQIRDSHITKLVAKLNLPALVATVDVATTGLFSQKAAVVKEEVVESKSQLTHTNTL